MVFEFGISLKGSLKTMLQHLRKELNDNMSGRGNELQLETEYKFRNTELHQDIAKNSGHNPAGSETVQLLLYLQFQTDNDTTDAGILGYSQCKWNVPTKKPATDDVWKSIWIPLFRRSSLEETLPSKILNKRFTCGVGIQHLRMFIRGEDTAYVFLLHDWQKRMLWIPQDDRDKAVQRVIQYQHQIHLLGSHPGYPSHSSVNQAYEVTNDTINPYPRHIEEFNIHTDTFNQTLYENALQASQTALPNHAATQTDPSRRTMMNREQGDQNRERDSSTRTRHSQGVGPQILNQENNHDQPPYRNVGPQTSHSRNQHEARIHNQQSQTIFRDIDTCSHPTGAHRNDPNNREAPPARVDVPLQDRQTVQNPERDPRHVNFQQSSSLYPETSLRTENSLRTPTLSPGSTFDSDGGTYETAGSISHGRLNTRGPDLHEGREPVLHSAMTHDLTRPLQTNPSRNSTDAMYDYPYFTSDNQMASDSGERNTDQSQHTLLEQAANLRDSRIFHPRLVEVIGDDRRQPSTSASPQSWNSLPGSPRWKEADKNQLLQLLHDLKKKQEEQEAGREQSSHRVAPAHPSNVHPITQYQSADYQAGAHPLTEFQGNEHQGGSSFVFNFSTEQLNNAVATLQSQLEKLDIRREPLPLDLILAQQQELKEQIEIQMSGLNKVNCQIKALTSDSSDVDEVENWNLDVIIASTSPDLLSPNMQERLAMMDKINNRLKKKLTKQAVKLQTIKAQQRSLALQQVPSQIGQNLQEPRRSPRMSGVDSVPDLTGLSLGERRRLQSDVRY